MDIGRMLSWTADRYPGRLAVGGPRPLTWRQWDARTNQLARALAGQGVRPGDRVAFLLAGGEPMASLHLAAQKLGAAAVPLSIRFGPPELKATSVSALYLVPAIYWSLLWTGRLPQAWTVTHLAAYAKDGSGLPSLKRPKRYIAVDRIPTSAVGKILRRELTEGRYHPLAEVRP
jgi:acyl-CoA synthetase (AMP-forming)/AMP-acid ligase II